MLTSTGIITYDPYRGDMKRRTIGWCVVDVDKEITRYYRWWLKHEKHIHLQPPAWDAHISVLRNVHTDHPARANWKYKHRKLINFKYDPSIIRCADDNVNGGQYYWLDVYSSELDEIRDMFGQKKHYRMHITVGRTYHYEARKPKTRK